LDKQDSFQEDEQQSNRFVTSSGRPRQRFPYAIHTGLGLVGHSNRRLKNQLMLRGFLLLILFFVIFILVFFYYYDEMQTYF